MRRLKRELGHVPLVRLSPPGIQEAYERLSLQGLSDYSVLQVHRTLHRVLDRAFHWGLCPRNAAALVLPPRPRPRQMTALTSEQLMALLETSAGQPLYPLWAVLRTAGLRLGEALGLQWRDVDLAAGRIRIQQALQRQAGVGLVLTHLKTLRSRARSSSPSWPSTRSGAIAKPRNPSAQIGASSSGPSCSPKMRDTHLTRPGSRGA